MATALKKKVKKTPSKGNKKSGAKWSARVMQTSDAMDLQPNIFTSKDPSRIARSLKKSAEESKRKKGTSFQSAMSMLNFYINRGGKNLPAVQKNVLEKAKVKLREVFDKPSK